MTTTNLNDQRDSRKGDQPWVRNYTEAEREELKAQKAAGKLLPGHKNRRGKKYPKSKITEIDLKVLRFLAKFKYASAHQVSLVRSVRPKTAHDGLKQLEELKLVDRIKRDGTKWFITQKAERLLKEAGYLSEDDTYQIIRKDRPEERIGHMLAVSQVAAHLLGGTRMFNGQPQDLSPDQLVNELTIQREFGANKKLVPSSFGQGAAGEKLKRSVLRDVIENRSLSWNEAVDMNPALWTLTHGRTEGNTHAEVKFPDLVINLESQRTSKTPLSIAIEVELEDKAFERYVKIMRTYAADRFVYAKVVYVLPARRDALRKKIARAAKKAGLDASRIVFIQLLSSRINPETGKYYPYSDFAWKL